MTKDEQIAALEAAARLFNTSRESIDEVLSGQVETLNHLKEVLVGVHSEHITLLEKLIQLIKDEHEPEPEPVLINIYAVQDDYTEGAVAEFVVEISRSLAPGEVVSAHWTTSHVSALPNLDYLHDDGVIEFVAGDPLLKKVYVTTVNNNVHQPSTRQFSVLLHDIIGAEPDISVATVAIIDDDLPEDPGPEDGPMPLGRLAWLQPAAPITEPVIYQAGQMKDFAFALMVVVSWHKNDQYYKFMGGWSTESDKAAGGIGVMPGGKLQAFVTEPFTELTEAKPFPRGVPTLVAWGISDSDQWAQVDDNQYVAKQVPSGLVPWDGEVAVGAGYYKTRVPRDKLRGEVRAFVAYDNRADAVAAIEFYKEYWRSLLEAPAGPEPDDGTTPPPDDTTPPPSGDGLEPEAKDSTQIQVTSLDRRSIYQGMGFGAGGWTDAPKVTPSYIKHMRALTSEAGMNVLRLWTPEKAGFAKTYRDIHKCFLDHVAHPLVLGTGFLYRSKLSPEKFAEGIARSRDEGVAVKAVGYQNESDGHTDNFMPPNQIADNARRIRQRMDQLGLQNVVLICSEWAHMGSKAAIQEYHELNKAALVPGSVAYGAGHHYSDCSRPEYNGLWASHVFETEIGNHGTPHSVARLVACWTHSCVVSIAHIGFGSTSQALIYDNDQKSPQYYAYKLIGTTIGRDTQWYGVSSNDRVSGMSADYDKYMVRSPGKNPRLQAALGMKTSGKIWLAAVNTTQGNGVTSPYVNACWPATNIQPTYKLPVNRGGTYDVHVLAMGASQPAQYVTNAVAGYVRLRKMAPGALVVAVER